MLAHRAQKEVMQITGGKGVDVVFDPVGECLRLLRMAINVTARLAHLIASGLLVPSLKCVAWNARLVVVGFAGGTIEKVSAAPWKTKDGSSLKPPLPIQVPANLLLLKQVSIVGLFWGATFGQYHFIFRPNPQNPFSCTHTTTTTSQAFSRC